MGKKFNTSTRNILAVACLITVVVTASFLLAGNGSDADNLPDFDQDGLFDKNEIEIYKTDPARADTDGDGYEDGIEIENGFSPLEAYGVRLENADFDLDHLSDLMELNFNTDIKNPDTDGDGYEDGIEVNSGYDPLSDKPVKLLKSIEIDTGERHELDYFLDDVKLGSFLISAGLPNMPTPKGHFKIENKNPKAWSSYGLWMPYWMAIDPSGRFGIHELPIWPSGYREGEDHLGRPASHGCVRLGENAAKFLYDWAEIGTPVYIY